MFGVPLRGGQERGEQAPDPGAVARCQEVGSEVQNGMSRRDAGRKGGLTTKKRYGAGFYQTIGRKGGKKGGLTRAQHISDKWAAL